MRRPVHVGLCVLASSFLAGLGTLPAPGAAPLPLDPVSTRVSTARSSLGRTISTITDPRLPEISGCAITSRGVWVHNDSGNPPELFLVERSSGRVKRRVVVKGALNTDWEDMAAESGQLFIGDIGDNSASRPFVSVFRLKEAAPLGPAVALRITYPDGPHNAEALLVHRGDAYIITKVDEPTASAAVYRLSQAASLAAGQYQAEKVGSITISNEISLFPNRITGADFSERSRRVVLRTYARLYVLSVPPGGDFDDVWHTTPRPVDTETLVQAEAVCFDPDGTRVLTTTERLPAPLVERVL